MSTLAARTEVLALDVTCADDTLTVALSDGPTITVPLVWFPRLVAATSRQRRQWQLIGGGIGIHWESVDEDISVASLLQPECFMRLPNDLPHPTTRVQSRNRKKPPTPARGRP
jgi:hypothetical protein